jgi:hypothetical protein
VSIRSTALYCSWSRLLCLSMNLASRRLFCHIPIHSTFARQLAATVNLKQRSTKHILAIAQSSLPLLVHAPGARVRGPLAVLTTKAAPALTYSQTVPEVYSTNFPVIQSCYLPIRTIFHNTCVKMSDAKEDESAYIGADPPAYVSACLVHGWLCVCVLCCVLFIVSFFTIIFLTWNMFCCVTSTVM